MTPAWLLMGLWLAGLAAWLLEGPWWAVTGLGIPALMLLPGWALARWRDPRASALQSAVDAAWFGVGIAALGVAAARFLGGSAWGLWVLSGAGLAVGLHYGRSRLRPALPSRRALLGLVVLFGTVGTMAWTHSPALSRGLDVGWYQSQADQLPGQPLQLRKGAGWGPSRWIPSPEEGALALVDPEGNGGELTLDTAGPLLVLLRGPLNANLRVQDSTGQVRGQRIQRDVTEKSDQGPVPRYLDRGMAAVYLEASAGPLQIQIEDAEPDALVYVLPSQEAIWALDRSGEARFLHYYQLLNKVENQRWALETLDNRHLTINQPPLWAYVLAVPAALVDGEIRGANLLFLFVLILVGLTGLALVEACAPDAAWAAWALPGLYAGVHFNMMVGPGSTNFPDSLYTAALLGGLLALLRTPSSGPGNRLPSLGLVAGLLRYPGTVVITLWALLQGAISHQFAKASLRRLWIWVGLLSLVMALGAAATGVLGEWLDILWFETGPEHWRNVDPEDEGHLKLLERPQVFYTEWANFMGLGSLGAGALWAWLALVALVLWADRLARWILACILGYSLMLCTIDHFPSHYFLPLVAGMGVSMVVATRRLPVGAIRELGGLALALWVLFGAL